VTETEALSRVDLARYDPGWADRFAEERARLLAVAGTEAESRRYFARR